jgi:ankyrin repeat domain-containing protein 17
MSNTPTHSIAASVSQPQTPTPSPIISPSAMLPIYPAIDIDAQVSSAFRKDGFPGITLLLVILHI